MLPRDRQPELMDDPSLPASERRQAMAGLARLNRVSGIAGTMYRRLMRYAEPSGQVLRVLDVASGAGDLPIAWARRAQREGAALQITTLDVAEVAAAEQQRRAKAAGVVIDSVVHDCLKQPLPCGFDVVTCSLFMHHLDQHDALKLLQSMQAVAGRAMLICDIDRSTSNLAMIGLATRLMTRSRVVHTDAIRSVRAAFTCDEFRALAEEALLRPIQVERSFPCRFIATIDELTVPVIAPSFA